MSKLSSFFVGAGSVCLALGLIPGCNAALGIEEAQLRPEGAGGTGAGSVVHYAGDNICRNDNSACFGCVTSQCAGASTQCLESHDCRGAMDDYNACLGKPCAAADCFDKLVADPQLGCFENCFPSCTGPMPAPAPVYSACQLYCACLGANCIDNLTAKYGGDQATCLADCESLLKTSPELVTCRRTHCELAGISKDLTHCDHAIGHTFCASAAELPPRDDSPTGCQKSLNSFACTVDSDCCSGNCAATKSCQPPQ